MGKYLSFRQWEKNTESDWRTRKADENAHYSRNAGKLLEIAGTESILTGLGVPRNERTQSILRWLSKNGMAEIPCLCSEPRVEGAIRALSTDKSRL